MFKPKKCKSCGEVFHPSAPCNLYCSKCAKEQAKLRQREGQFRYRRRKGDPNVGVGKGNGEGSKVWRFKKTTNITFHTRASKELKEQRRYCERCGKDLKDASRYHYALHHKDHDRTNNTIENFELLCKQCHQIEHECWKAFEGATTNE